MRADLPALGRLRDDLKAVRLDLAVPGAGGTAHEGRPRRSGGRLSAPAARADGRAGAHRRRRLDGAGKSTPLNSLVGSVVSPAGVLRPTTARAGARLPSGRPRVVRGRARPARPAAGERRRGAAGDASARADGIASARARAPRLASTSTPSSPRTARSPASSSRRPTAGFSSRPPLATPTRCPGISVRRDRGTAPSLVLNRAGGRRPRGTRASAPDARGRGLARGGRARRA